MPNLLIDKIAEHIQASKAAKLYICNVMTQPGETDGYTAADHVRALQAQGGTSLIDTILVNDTYPEGDSVEAYRETGAEPVLVNADELAALGVRTIRASLMDDSGRPVHDSERLGKVVMDIVYALQTDIEPHILEYYLKRNDH